MDNCIILFACVPYLLYIYYILNIYMFNFKIMFKNINDNSVKIKSKYNFIIGFKEIGQLLIYHKLKYLNKLFKFIIITSKFNNIVQYIK